MQFNTTHPGQQNRETLSERADSCKQLYRLHGDNERLTMLANASNDMVYNKLDLHEGETSELVETMKRYTKNKPVLDKNILFG